MAILTRDEILNAPDIKTEKVEVPEWGGEVLVRALSGAERDRFEASIISAHGKKTRRDLRNIRAKLVALCVVDEQGRKLFSEADIEALGKKNAAALDRVFSVAQRLSAVSEDDVDEMIENFGDGQSDDSGSD